MNLEKLLDALTPDELSDVLRGAARRVYSSHKNGNRHYPLQDADGTELGYIVLGEYRDPESTELLAELAVREHFEEPELSADDASAMLHKTLEKLSRS
jgi:hypothetical protein